MVSEDIREQIGSYVEYQAKKPREDIIDVLRKGQQRFREAVASFDGDSAAKRPSQNDWNVREVVLHIITLESRNMERVECLARGVVPPYRDDMGDVRPDAGESYDDLLAELERVNDVYLSMVRNLPQAPDLPSVVAHPWFGELNSLQWAILEGTHYEGHARQAEGIAATLVGGS